MTAVNNSTEKDKGIRGGADTSEDEVVFGENSKK
jgi:hypothetical protein